VLNFPLDLRFKTLAIARQISVEDANGKLLWYVRMKAFRLKEAVTIFADREQMRPLFEIQADRVIDFGGTYQIQDATTHAPIGTIRNQGMRSLWRSHYELLRNGQPLFNVREENPWIKVLDGLVSDIPVVGLLSGYVLHPTYRVTPANSGADEGEGSTIMRVRKQPAFLEGRYSIERLKMLPDEEERLVVLGMLMLVLLQKQRG
jgi:hypothetical protein